MSSISIGLVLYFCLSLRYQDKFWMHAMSFWKGKDINEENVQSLAAAAADAYIAEHKLVPLLVPKEPCCGQWPVAHM